mmetsp:Transcript_22029/g.51436  ORF Transcript_22029/g.51436 Transcript_22029/m.51436 type:complete len:121 (+) Transcript_22029:109-471(+)
MPAAAQPSPSAPLPSDEAKSSNVQGASTMLRTKAMEAMEWEAEDWVVLEHEVWAMPEPVPTTAQASKVRSYERGTWLQGACIVVEGVKWLRTDHDGKPAWVLIDGYAVGAGRKFLEPIPG